MSMRILVTGATGKVGQAFIDRLLARPEPAPTRSCARCATTASWRRAIGSRWSRARSRAATRRRGAWRASPTSCTWRPARRRPTSIMDVAVKGLFWLLEACRHEPDVRAVHPDRRRRRHGPLLLPAPDPGHRDAEAQRLSRLLRAVEGARGGDARAVLHPVRPQRLLPARAVDHGEGRLQATSCRSATTCSAARAGATWSGASGRRATSRRGAVPVMLDPDGVPVKRNFVHVDDLCAAILAALDNPRARQQTFNVCMDEPVDYGELGAYLKQDARAAERPDPDALPLDLARQHQGEVPARLAAALRPGARWSTPPATTSARPTIRARSGTPAEDGR